MNKNRMFGFKCLSKTSPERRKFIQVFTNSNWLDYMITIFLDRHFGMDGDGVELAIPTAPLRTESGTGYSLLGGYDELAH